MDTIDAILQSAYDLFSERGFERTPVSNIAKHAGVAAGTIIYHFKTKENLLRVLNWFTLNRLYSSIRQKTQNAHSGMTAINAFVEEFFASVAAHPRETTLLMETFFHSRGRQADAATLNMDINILTIRNGLVNMLETLIREGCADGSTRPVDPSRTGLGILAMLIGSARLILMHDMPERELLSSSKEFIQARLSPEVHAVA